jgi:RimJ/RimL family protein N-acetyltransferase
MQPVTPAIPILTTPRLLLRPLDITDAPAVQALFPRWEIVRFLSTGVPWPYPADGALTYVRDVALPAVQQGKEWHWTIRPNSHPDTLIGAISLMEREDDNRGFWLDPAWQGQGLMLEASSAVTDYWFDGLGQLALRTLKAAENRRSRRISERTGMRLIKTVEHPFIAGRLPADIWEITREEWQNRPR